MPNLVPTVETIKEAEPWVGGIYPAKVHSHEEKVSKPNKDTGETSMNDWVVFEITGSSPMSGRKIRNCFSEKFTLPAINFFRALGAKVEPGVALEWDKTIGRELRIGIGLETFNGRVNPKVSDFFPQE